MLECTTKNLEEELRASFANQSGYTREVPRRIRTGHGQNYCTRLPVEEQHLENMVLKYTARVAPQVAFANPRVRVTSGGSGRIAQVGLGFHYGANHWITETRMHRSIEEQVADAMHCYGVTMTRMERLPSWWSQGDDVVMPREVNIAPWDFAWDPGATRQDDTRYQVVRSYRDRNELLNLTKDKDLGWDFTAIQGVGRTSFNDPVTGAARRDQIEIFEMLVYGKSLESIHTVKGLHNGVMYTFAHTGPSDSNGGSNEAIGQLVQIRAPRNWWGPPWGPFSVLGIHRVPHNACPLGPIPANWANAVAQNDIDRALKQAIEAYKRVMVYDVENEVEVQRVLKAKNEFAVGVQAFEQAKVSTQEFGGPTQFHQAYHAYTVQRTDSGMGLDATWNGQTGGADSATEATFAAGASGATLDTMRREVYLAVEQRVRTFLWMAYHTKRVNFPLSAEVAEKLGMPNAHFAGGLAREMGIPFERLHLEVEAYSMERNSDARRQAAVLQGVNLMASTVPLVAQYPYIPWSDVYRAIGEAIHLPEMGRWLDPQVAAMVAAQQQVTAQAGGQAAPRAGPGAQGGGPRPTTPQQRGQRRTDRPQGQQAGQAGHYVGNAIGAQTRARGGR